MILSTLGDLAERSEGAHPNPTPPRLRSSEHSAKPVLDYFGCLSSGIAENVEFDCISILSGLAFRQNSER